jgi:SAM-dependent methyltransferase
MDKIAQYLSARWRALAQANALFTRPYLDLDTDSARQKLDPYGRLGDLTGKRVLCLAGGGGQQSAAFALLGARVTVVDISEEQLARDREAAAHYAFDIETLQGDMRDLSRLDAHVFNIVWQPYSLNFVPDARIVFREVARLMRPGGIYHFHCANPFVSGIGEQDWNGEGYVLKQPYVDGAELTYPDQAWVAASREAIPPPREYRHTLGTLVNGLVEQGFVLRHLSDSEDFVHDPQATPGTWSHLISVIPPWLKFWADYVPETASPLVQSEADRINNQQSDDAVTT